MNSRQKRVAARNPHRVQIKDTLILLVEVALLLVAGYVLMGVIYVLGA